jgi:hypothetical protein
MPSCDVVLEPATRSAPHYRLFGDGVIATLQRSGDPSD